MLQQIGAKAITENNAAGTRFVKELSKKNQPKDPKMESLLDLERQFRSGIDALLYIQNKNRFLFAHHHFLILRKCEIKN